MDSLTREFESLSIGLLQEWIACKREESLRLEFKAIRDLDSRDNRKLFAHCLSGFANSSGGIVVWGVDARSSGPGEPDCAVALQPIPFLAGFVARLNSLTGELVTPLVEGARHRAIAAGPDSGCAVTLIPESESPPHMAKGGDDRYYKRSGDSFYKMEHFDLEDMFGRRKRPSLTLSSRLKLESVIGDARYKGAAVIGIENRGRGLATWPYLSLRFGATYRVSTHGLDGNGHEGLDRLATSQSGVWRYGASSNIAIHVGTTHEVTRCSFEVDVVDGRVQLPAPLTIHYELGAEGIQLTSGTLTIEPQDLVAAVLPSARTA